jgi:hypothetical protein
MKLFGVENESLEALAAEIGTIHVGGHWIRDCNKVANGA